MVEEQFRIEADKILLKYSPMIQEGTFLKIIPSKFSEALERMDSEIMDLSYDTDPKLKRKIADEVRQKFINFVSDHEKK